MSPLATHTSSLEKCQFRSSTHFSIGLFGVVFSIYLWFPLQYKSFWVKIRSHWFIFVFIVIRRWIKQDIAVIYVKEHSSYVLVAMFFSKLLEKNIAFFNIAFFLCSSLVSSLTFRFLIHSEFICMYGVRKRSHFILLQVAIQFPQHHLLKSIFPPHVPASSVRLVDHRCLGLFLGFLSYIIALYFCFCASTILFWLL